MTSKQIDKAIKSGKAIKVRDCYGYEYSVQIIRRDHGMAYTTMDEAFQYRYLTQID